eukprot:scaffold215573_cov32-Tisochrysis_lutea.AAC.1
MRFVCLGLLTAGCQALAPPTELALRQAPAANGNVLSRRAVIGAAASALAVSPLASVAADGSWTYHEGGFTGEFWDGFKSTDSGFMYKFVEPGEGDKPVNMQQVFVHYTGYLLDGTRFDSSYDRSDPFKFRLGKGKVIPGWEAVVAGMRPGQKVIVKIPPQYAYGDKSVGPIPPNSPLSPRTYASLTVNYSAHQIFYMELVRLGNIKGDKPRLSAITDAVNPSK